MAICTRNRAAFLTKAVESVLPQVEPGIEILVVDNASADNTCAVGQELARQHPSVRYVRESQIGLSAARNTALREAFGQYVLFLDDDAVAESGWIQAYKSFFCAPPSCHAAVAGGAVFPQNEVPMPRWLPAKEGVLNWNSQMQRCTQRGGVWGCNFALHRRTALALGGFDTSLGRNDKSLGAHEETEFFERFRQAGHEVWWLPQARIRHFTAAQRFKLRWLIRNSFEQGRSSVLMRLRLLSRPGDRLWYWTLRLGVVPFQMGLCVLAGVAALPFCRQQRSVRAMLQLVRISGVSWQLLACTGRILSAR